MLRGLLRRYCRLYGIGMDETLTATTAVMPGGAVLKVYERPIVLCGRRYYGTVEFPYRDRCRMAYLGEDGAVHLYGRLYEYVRAMELLAN
jgi:hypothetical protein